MNPVSIHYSYAHEDEEFREKLVTHLTALRRGLGLYGGDPFFNDKVAPTLRVGQAVNPCTPSGDYFIILRAPAGAPGFEIGGEIEHLFPGEGVEQACGHASVSSK